MKNNLFLSLFKQAPDGLLAHVYEHAYALSLQQLLNAQGMYEVTDYSLWAKTYGTTVMLDIRASSPSIARKVRRAQRTVDATELPKPLIRKAAEECALEYRRPLEALKSPFYKEIAALHAAPWQPQAQLGVAVAHRDTSVNTVFVRPGIQYGARSAKKFDLSAVHYQVAPKAYKNDPAMKALAIVVVQAVALNALQELRGNHTFYDDGDEWNEGATTVAYRNFLVFPKGHVDSDALSTRLQAIVDSLKSDAFINSVLYALQQAYKDERQQYFSVDALNRITNGTIMGYAGWRQVATKANVQAILHDLSVEIV